MDTFFQSVSSNSSPVTVNELSAGQCVTLALSACTSAGCSSWNATSSNASAEVCTPSDRPVGRSGVRLVTLDANTLSLTLTWTAPTLWNGANCRCVLIAYCPESRMHL